MAVLQMGPRSDERRQLDSNYTQRQAAYEDEEIKQVQRDRVLNHIVSNHQSHGMRFFGLPGLHWMFERQLRDQWAGEIALIGVERNYSIMQSAIPYMPGTSRNRTREEIKTGSLTGFETNIAKTLWCEGATFVGIGREEIPNRDHRREFRKKYKNWTAVWWDFQSPICEPTLACFRKTENVVDDTVEDVPMSYTLLAAREPRNVTRFVKLAPEDLDAVHKRAEFVLEWHNQVSKKRRMEIVDVYPYLSGGGVLMMLVNTMLRRK